MNEAPIVCGLERVRDLRRDSCRRDFRQPTTLLEKVGQALPIDKLHHDRSLVLVDEDVVDGDDPWMRQAGRRPRLGREPLPRAGVGQEMPVKQLQRHQSVELLVVRAPHLGHAAYAEAVLQPVSIEEQDADRGRRCRGAGHRDPAAVSW